MGRFVLACYHYRLEKDRTNASITYLIPGTQDKGGERCYFWSTREQVRDLLRFIDLKKLVGPSARPAHDVAEGDADRYPRHAQQLRPVVQIQPDEGTYHLLPV